MNEQRQKYLDRVNAQHTPEQWQAIWEHNNEKDKHTMANVVRAGVGIVIFIVLFAVANYLSII